MFLWKRLKMVGFKALLPSRTCRPIAQTLVVLLVGLPVWHMLVNSGDRPPPHPDGLPSDVTNWALKVSKQESTAGQIPSTTTDLGTLHKNNTNNTSVQPGFNLTSLLQKKEPLQLEDVSVVGTVRNVKGFLTIGIPTIYRQHAGSTYLQSTLQSIVDQTSEEEKDKVVVLLCVADFNQTYRNEVVRHVQKHYLTYLKSGFINIMLIKEEAYPPLTKLKQNYKDSKVRVKWRSKQVADFAFMFYYGRNISEYYLQIEDDVICAPEFVQQISNFIRVQKQPWVTLEFSELGFIGKLFKSSDLEQLTKFLLLFYQEQPVDWLYRYYAKLLTYPKMPLRKPTLFQHIGEHSSLASKKLNKLKDKFFAGGKIAEIPVPQPVIDVKNPPASVYTNMNYYQKFFPINAYKSISYFWGKKPSQNDSFFVIFNKPEYLKKITIETGHPFQRNDYLRNGRVDVSPHVISVPQTSKTGQCVCDNYHEVGKFVESGHLEVDNLDTKLKFAVKCLRILVTEDQEEWLIIHQIAIETK